MSETVWPAFLAVIKFARGSFGSGVILGRRYILTCAHVAFPDQYRVGEGCDAVYSRDRPHANEEIRHRFPVGKKIPNVTIVGADGVERPAIFAGIAENDDMALLKVELPFDFAATLNITNHETDVIKTYGVQEAVGGRFRAVSDDQRIREDNLPAEGAERGFTMTLPPTEGMSGGPVLWFCEAGKPHLGGLTYLGGDLAEIGQAYSSGWIKKFLDEALGANDLAIDEGEDMADDPGALGYARRFDLARVDAPPIEFQFTGVEAGKGARYLARCPVTLKQSGRSPGGHDELTMFEALTEDAVSFIDEISRDYQLYRFTLPLREALSSEFSSKQEKTTDQPPRMVLPLNTPCTIADLDSSKDGLAFPPIGGAEWSIGDHGASSVEMVGEMLSRGSGKPYLGRVSRAGALVAKRACVRPGLYVHSEKMIRDV